MSIAIAKNHMAEMKMLGMLAVLDKTLTEATRGASTRKSVHIIKRGAHPARV